MQQQCPVCKGAVDANRVIPLYGRRDGPAAQAANSTGKGSDDDKEKAKQVSREEGMGLADARTATTVSSSLGRNSAIPDRPRSMRPPSPTAEVRNPC